MRNGKKNGKANGSEEPVDDESSPRKRLSREEFEQGMAQDEHPWTRRHDEPVEPTHFLKPRGFPKREPRPPKVPKARKTYRGTPQGQMDRKIRKPKLTHLKLGAVARQSVPGRKRGRPPGGGKPSPHLTPEVRGRILQALRGGNYREVAARWAGIEPGMLGAWMSRKGEFYVQFQKEVQQAEQGAEIRMVALIMQAAAIDPKHAQWWLERKFPERWGRHDRVDVAATVELLAKQAGLTDEETAAALQETERYLAELRHVRGNR